MTYHTHADEYSILRIHSRVIVDIDSSTHTYIYTHTDPRFFGDEKSHIFSLTYKYKFFRVEVTLVFT